MGAELDRMKALLIIEELAECGMARDENLEGARLATVIMTIGFEIALKFSAEHPEYAMALYKGVRNTGMTENQWRKAASAEFIKVMERYPIASSSMSEDEVGYVVDLANEDRR